MSKYDRNQKIVRINAAARALFEVPSEAQCQGRDYQQFLTSCIRSDEQSSFVSSGQWLMREVVARQQHAAPEHPIVLDIPPLEHGVPILADAGRITYVLTTYLTNALTASPPGRPVEVQLRVEEALARVSVHNEGAGIAREDLDHLWERFYRAKGSAVQHGLDLSCGLPLYLCRVFIERHKGSVGVQSAPGQGDTFWLTVPITPSLGK